MYGRKVKLRFFFVLLIFAIFILSVFLILRSLEENVVYFKSPSDVKVLVEIEKKKIELIYLNKNSILNSVKTEGFLRSRLVYWYIFFKSFFPLIKILKEKEPNFLVIHLITSLPLVIFIFMKFKSKLILRISGLPKMTLFRKLLWKLAIKNVYKITCPTIDTFNNLSKFKFLREKLHVLNDPIININDIQKLRKKEVKVSENLKILESKYEPFKHRLFDDVLPKETINELLKLPLPAQVIENHTILLY